VFVNNITYDSGDDIAVVFGKPQLLRHSHKFIVAEELQTPSKAIAEHYGFGAFKWLMERYDQFHTIGTNLFVEYFVEEWACRRVS